MAQPQENASPVISPADLVSILAKAQERGFAATDHGRRGVVEDGGDFRPNDFAAIGRAAAAALPAPGVSGPLPAEEPAPRRVRDSAEPPSQPQIQAAKLPGPSAAEIEVMRQEAHAEGYRQGHAAGLAEAEAEALAGASQHAALQSAREIFLAAAEALATARPEQEAQLAAALSQAVGRLASERAGLAIESHPDAFAARLRLLAQRLAQGVRAVRLTLHPEDLALMQGRLEAEDGLALTLAADPALNRGDAIVTAPGLRLADLIAPGGAGDA